MTTVAEKNVERLESESDLSFVFVYVFLVNRVRHFFLKKLLNRVI